MTKFGPESYYNTKSKLVTWELVDPIGKILECYPLEPDKTGQNRLIRMNQILSVLHKHTSLKHCARIPGTENLLIYHPHLKCFQLKSRAYLTSLIGTLLTPFREELRIEARSYQTYSGNLFMEFNSLDVPNFVRDLSVIPFNDGNYCTKTKVFRKGDFISAAVDYRLPYNYEGSPECPIFDKFILDLAEGYVDRALLIMCVLNSFIFSRTDIQTWFHIFGKSRAGKSILQHIIHYLLGDEVTFITELNRINSDIFENQHMLSKKALVCADAADWGGALEVLKKISGGDPILIREKHENTYKHQVATCKVLIVGNYPLRAKDSGHALRKRHVFLKCSVGDKGDIPLIGQDPKTGGWTGVLLPEMSAIFRKIEKMDPELVRSTINGFPHTCPSQLDIWKEVMESMNPLDVFVEECLVPGGEAIMGLKPGKDLASIQVGKERGNIYPAYLEFTYRRGEKPVSLKNFKLSLENSLSSAKHSAHILRDNRGQILTGMHLRSDFWEMDSGLGGSLAASSPPATPPALPEKLTFKEEIKDSSPNEQYYREHGVDVTNISTKLQDFYRSLSLGRKEGVDPCLYERYISLFNATRFSRFVNSVTKKLVVEPSFVPKAAEPFLKISPIVTEHYKEKVLQVIQKDVVNMSSFGVMLKTYKPLGSSPRIAPQAGEFALNGMKRASRTNLFVRVGDLLERELGLVVVDLDIVGCFIAILLGLHQEFLPELHKAVREKGIWKTIEEGMHEKGLGSSFHKDSVKVCVYSAFFQGGKAAMREGILKRFRTNAGITEADFKKTDYFSEVSEFSSVIVSYMQSSKIISEIQSCAKIVRQSYIGRVIKGATGHEYSVTEDSFRNVYSESFMCYEMVLISMTMTYVKEQIPEMEMLFHMHDGCTVCLPKEKLGELTSLLNVRCEEVRKLLKLQHPISFEAQGVYGKVEDRDWEVDETTLQIVNQYKEAVGLLGQ